MSQIEKCPTCKKAVGDTDEALQCDVCDLWWHYSCMKNPKKDFKKLSDQPLWFCSKTCKQTNVNTNAETQNTPNISQQLSQILTSINELKDSIQFQNDQYNELKKTTVDIQNEVQGIKNENSKRDKEMQYVKQQLNTLRQEKLNNGLICFGIERQSNDNITMVVKNEFQRRNIPCEGIVSCSSKLQNKANKTIPPITIMFDSIESKVQTLDAARKARNAMYGDTRQSQNKSHFGLRELLTESTYQLLIETRTLLSKTYKYIWTKNGRIYIKKENEREAKWIKSEGDLRAISSSIQNSDNAGTSAATQQQQ